uniref:Uncharacterized protein n=1 Tax=Heterorhabditis bacteriophora TaxID=37862 RepID=A0A1I7X6E7_HETBA
MNSKLSYFLPGYAARAAHGSPFQPANGYLFILCIMRRVIFELTESSRTRWLIWGPMRDEKVKNK